MEQELMLAVAPIIPALGAIGAGIVGSAFAGKGDKKAAEAAQAEALEQERKRQQTLEGRFAAQQPLREESLRQLLDFGSKENPFSRRIGDERAAGIIGQIQSLQQQAGQVTADQRTAQVLENIANSDAEREKYFRSIERGGREVGEGLPGVAGNLLKKEGIREAGDVLRHFGFDIGPAQVEQLINSGQAGQIFNGQTGLDVLRSLGVNLTGANSNSPVF
jgi:hypothetical protein